MHEPRRWVRTLRPPSAGRRDRMRPRRAAAGSRRAGQEGVALVTVLILAAVIVALSIVASRDAITELPLSPEVVERYTSLAHESLEKQRQIESADSLSFEAYLQQYLSSERLSVR